MSKKTRFRAYQLGTLGSSFSYSVDDYFTLIEARFNDTNIPSIVEEMQIIGCETINCLHITSWDQDHCNYEELELILKSLKPNRIEYPGYVPNTDCGKNSLISIKNYCNQKLVPQIEISPRYVNGLESGERCQYNDVVYNPKNISDKHNDNCNCLFSHSIFFLEI